MGQDFREEWTETLGESRPAKTPRHPPVGLFLPSARLVAAFDEVAERAQAFGDKHGAAPETSLEALLAREHNRIPVSRRREQD